MPNFSYGLDEEQYYSVASIRLLMAAMLEMGLRDIEAGSYKELKNALDWFTGIIQDDAGFDFYFVLDVLELSAARRTWLDLAILKGKQRLELLKHLPKKKRTVRGLFVTSENYFTTKGKCQHIIRRNHKRRVSSR